MRPGQGNKRFHQLLVIALGALAVLAGSGALADASEHTIHIRNVVILPAGGGAPVAADILVTGGQITAVGVMAAPAASESIDAGGALVTPGFFDSRSIVGVVEVESGINSNDETVEDVARGAGFRIGLAFNRFSSLIPAVRAEGQTHALLVPDAGNQVFAGQSAIVDLSGSERSVRLDPSAVHLVLGEASQKHAGGSRANALTLASRLLDEAQLYRSARRDWRKGNLPQLTQDPADLEALVQVLAGEVPLALHVDRAADIEHAVRELATYKLRLVVVGGREAWKVAPLLARHNIPVVLNVLDNLPRSFDQLGARLDNAALLHEAGVQIAFMTEDQFSESRSLSQAAGVAVAYGLPWREAVRAVTVSPARIWGLGDQVGDIAVGREASFVIWSTLDPLEIGSAPRRMMIRGKWVDLTANRQNQLRDRYADPAARLTR